MHPRVQAEAQPAKPALILSATGEVVTFGELELRANRAAHALRALGLANGERLAVACDNRAEFLDLLWATQRAGLTFIPVSIRLTAGEVAYIVNDSGAKALVASDSLAELARGLVPLRDTMPGLAEILTIGPFDGLPDWGALCAAQPDTPVEDEEIGGRMAYSSGTTGRPKGILYPRATGSPTQPDRGALAFRDLYRLDGDTIYLSPAPLYHASPLGFTAAVQALGGTVVLMPKFDPEQFLAAIERYRVTAVQAVPTMFIRLLKLPDAVRLRYDVSSLKTVVHAAAPCPIPVKRAMIDWLGPILEEFYAGSEGNGHVTIGSEEWLRKPGSVGRAVVGQIHICNEEGDELPVGETGTVFFSGGRAFAYHNDATKTAASRNPQHPDWSTMGDIGRVDEEGYLFLSDRKDFMIISGGVNIYPQEVESLLVTHPKVADVAVFGVPNADFGEEVKAVVQPADWSDAGEPLAQELIGWCRSQLADIKCPRSIDFDAALPRADNGKLYKKEVKARYWPAG